MNRAKLLKTAKPLGFKEEMYRAFVELRKRQTRRIESINDHPICIDKDTWGNSTSVVWYGDYGVNGSAVKPRYQVGDIVYLTEPVQIETFSYDAHGGMADVQYLWERYDRPNVERNIDLLVEDVKKLLARKGEGAPYAPTTARFMRKVFAREFARVTDVRIERLQDISPNDCRAEGIPSENTDVGVRYCFGQLWDSINANREKGKYAWEANPYVWAYSLERLEVSS